MKTALDDLYAELAAIEPQIVYEREGILQLQKDIAMRDEVLVMWEERQRARQRQDFHVEEGGP